MSRHEHMREPLALAAAGALDEQELATLQRHLDTCADCAARSQQVRVIADTLRRLPTPQPSPQVVERALAAAQFALEAAHQRRSSHFTALLLGLFAWSFTLSLILIIALLASGFAGLSRLLAGNAPLWLAGYTTLAWMAGTAAVVLLGTRRREQRRMA